MPTTDREAADPDTPAEAYLPARRGGGTLNPPENPGDAPTGGIEHAHVIDLIAHDPLTDAVTMTMVERRRWDGSTLQMFQLQEKFNAYVSFALDGEMAEAYPALAGKPLRLRLECAQPPDEAVRHFLGLVREQLAFQGIEIEAVVTGGSCGSECACGS